MEYERSLNATIGQAQMIALCSFALPRCRASDVIDVVNSHQFALFSREGRWEMIETSQHKKTEQALRDSEERFRALTETAACGICMIHGKNICYANLEAEKITGYSRDELLNMGLRDIIHPDHLEFLQRETCMGRIGNLKGREIKILSGGGQEKWVLLSCGTVLINGRQEGVTAESPIT